MKCDNQNSPLHDYSFLTGSVKEDGPLATEIILADKVPTDPIGCPKCRGTTYSLEGYYRKDFTNEEADGNVLEENLDDETIKVIEVMICPACQIRWYIADEPTYRLYMENHELRVQLAVLNSLLQAPVRTMGEKN